MLLLSGGSRGKVSTALKAQMESGEFKKRNLPYGYRWDEEHSNMVFDEETAPIVRKIFQWKIEGLSLPAIADRLDAMNAPTPEFQKSQVGVRTGNAPAKKIWNKSSLTTIPVSYTHLKQLIFHIIARPFSLSFCLFCLKSVL